MLLYSTIPLELFTSDLIRQVRYDGYCRISSLYSAKVWEGVLSDENPILRTMEHYINGNETASYKIWETIVNDYTKDGADDGELLLIMSLPLACTLINTKKFTFHVEKNQLVKEYGKTDEKCTHTRHVCPSM